MNAWSELPLALALDALIDYRGKSPKKSETGIPVISAKVVKGGRVLDKIEQTISPNYYDEWMRRGLPQVGDVVMTTEGPLGEVARLDTRTAGYALGQRIVTMRGKPEILDNGFLKYLLLSPRIQDRLQSRATGTTVLGISQKSLREMPIPLAPISEQREIAAVLGAIDAKIELNRKTAATLEAMVRALYQSWFIDFDPVWAKSEGRAPAYIAAEIAALFPEKFGSNGLPKGWEMSSIYDFSRVQYGAAFKSALFNSNGEGRPLVRIRDLKNHRAGVYTTEIHKQEHSIQPGDTVVGMDGDFTAYSWCNEAALMNQRVCSFLPHAPEYRAFIRQGIVPQLKAEEDAAVATTVIHLGKKDIDKFRLPAPGTEIMATFSSVAEPLLDREVRLRIESNSLAALRDTLLPRLMSGQLHTVEADKLVAEVA